MIYLASKIIEEWTDDRDCGQEVSLTVAPALLLVVPGPCPALPVPPVSAAAGNSGDAQTPPGPEIGHKCWAFYSSNIRT